MFYLVDLLSHRRRGKLAPCWLAATLNQKLFKRHYNSDAIKKLDVIRISEEILKIIQQRGGARQRFSLYLSSQLLWGIIKIHQYQITCYQKDISMVLQTLDELSIEEDFDVVQILDITMELPVANENLLPDPSREDLHLLPEDVESQMMMQDAHLNFGVLTDDELEFLFNRNGEIAFDMQNTDDNRNRDVSEIAEEAHREMQSPRGILRYPPVLAHGSTSKSKYDGKVSVTPQKRQTRPQVETPTKRRRLSFEDVIPVPLEDVVAQLSATAEPSVPLEDVTVPQILVEGTVAPASPLPEEQMPAVQRAELDMELEPVHPKFFKSKKQPKRGKVIDKKIRLEDKSLKEWHQNTRIYCKSQLDLPQVHRPSPAMELFDRPSHQPKRWASKLYDLFADNVRGPFTAPDQEDAVMSMQEIRAATSRLDHPMEEWSTLGNVQATTAADGTAMESISNIPPTDIQMAETATVRDSCEASTVPLAEADMAISEQDINAERMQNVEMKVDDADANSLPDVEVMLEKRWRQSEIRDRVSKSSTPIAAESVPLTVQDVLAMLEVLWRDREVVKFNDFIPRDTYSTNDVVHVFNILLVLHAKKKLVLRQSACYRTLWIRKLYFD